MSDEGGGVAARVLDAVRGGHLAAIADLAAPEVALRASLPSGSVECTGREALRATLEAWVGGVVAWEVVELERVDLGGKVRLRWRARARFDPPHDAWHLIEQVCFLTGRGRIDAIDLACSGFLVERARDVEVAGA